jgi:hypothetical protein
VFAVTVGTQGSAETDDASTLNVAKASRAVSSSLLMPDIGVRVAGGGPRRFRIYPPFYGLPYPQGRQWTKVRRHLVVWGPSSGAQWPPGPRRARHPISLLDASTASEAADVHRVEAG